MSDYQRFMFKEFVSFTKNYKNLRLEHAGAAARAAIARRRLVALKQLLAARGIDVELPNG